MVERYLALPHDFKMVQGTGPRGNSWLWLCKLHTWRCPHHLTEFFTIPHYNVQERLL